MSKFVREQYYEYLSSAKDDVWINCDQILEISAEEKDCITLVNGNRIWISEKTHKALLEYAKRNDIMKKDSHKHKVTNF